MCDAVCARVKVDCVALTHTYDPPEPVDIFGWSRGAIAALTLAEKLNTEGCTCRTKCTRTTRDCTSKDGKALFTETTTTFVAVSTIKPVPVRFLGLLDPVNTGGAQMIGTNASTVPSNVQTVFLALSVESTTVGYFMVLHPNLWVKGVVKSSARVQQTGWGRPFSPRRRIASGVKAMRRRGERGSGRSLEVQQTGLP